MTVLLEFKNNRVKPKTVERYACDIVNHLLPREFKREVLITIQFKKNIPNASGYCDGNRDHAVLEIARGSVFDGEYWPYNVEHQMKTIAHELVHAKQFIRGEINAVDYVWRRDGKDYSHLDNETYPWEVEAYSMQETLFDLYWRKQ